MGRKLRVASQMLADGQRTTGVGKAVEGVEWGREKAGSGLGVALAMTLYVEC